MSSIQPATQKNMHARWLQYANLEKQENVYQGLNVLVGKDSHAKMILPEGHSKIKDLVVRGGTIKIEGLPPVTGSGILSSLSCKDIFVINGEIQVENAHINFRYCFQMSEEQFARGISKCPSEPSLTLPRSQKIPRTAIHPHLFTLTSEIDLKVHNVLATIVKAAFRGDLEVARLYVAAGADQEPTGHKKTALMLAAGNNHTPAIRALIEVGAEIEATDFFGNTALHVATMSNRIQAIRCLLSEKANPHAKNRLDKTPITHAVDSGSMELINLFVEFEVDFSKEKSLDPGCISAEAMHAAVNDDTAAMQRLLARGINIEGANISGDTALTLAAKHGHKAMVELLIGNKADMTAQSTQGTATDCAIRNGHATVVSALLNAGAQTEDIGLDELDAFGANDRQTEVLKVLIEAIMRTYPDKMAELFAEAARHGKRHVITCLLKAGVDSNQTALGHTPLAHAAIHAQLELVELLRLTGANVALAIASLVKSDHLHATKLLVKERANLDPTLLDDETLLFYAAMTGNEAMMQTLLSKIDPNTTDESGETPLARAAKNNQQICAKILIEEGADPNLIDEDGKTALSHAAIRGHVEMVGLIVAKTNIKPISHDNLVLSHVYVRDAYAHVRKDETPNAQELAVKHRQTIRLLGNAIYESAPPITNVPPNQPKLKWAHFLPTKKSPSFELLVTAKTVEDVCEGLEEINQSLIACDREFAPAETIEFAEAMKNPVIQNNMHHLRMSDLLSHNATIQQSLLSKRQG